MWCMTILSIVGVILNIKKRNECFIVWIFTNASWAIYDFKIGAYSQSALFGIYFALSIWGLHEWKITRRE